jgi:hypothetical protein
MMENNGLSLEAHQGLAKLSYMGKLVDEGSVVSPEKLLDHFGMLINVLDEFERLQGENALLKDRLSTLQKVDRAAQSAAGMDILPEVWKP